MRILRTLFILLLLALTLTGLPMLSSTAWAGGAVPATTECHAAPAGTHHATVAECSTACAQALTVEAPQCAGLPVSASPCPEYREGYWPNRNPAPPHQPPRSLRQVV